MVEAEESSSISLCVEGNREAKNRTARFQHTDEDDDDDDDLPPIKIDYFGLVVCGNALGLGRDETRMQYMEWIEVLGEYWAS